ncbi:glycosyltransferase [Vibrio mediterranei]|uniref:glycosyltransferase n=1 Tax=Vibrio mediterranei TaxID=689 RepID=UPI0038CEF708
MKVIHIFRGSVNLENANGVNVVLDAYGRHFTENDLEFLFIGISKNYKCETKVNRGSYSVNVTPNVRTIIDKLTTLIEKDTIFVHLHSVWNLDNIRIMRFCLENAIPYAVTVHSGLHPDRVESGKKYFKSVFSLLQDYYFGKARFIHALTKEEATHLRNRGYKNELIVIPNGQDKNDNFVVKSKLFSNCKITIGYLGRLSIEKNLSELIYSLSIFKSKNDDVKIDLVIGGPKTDEYFKLQKLVNELGLSDDVRFLGLIKDKDKDSFFKSIDFYVHPAKSDVVSIAVIEALHQGIPSIVSRGSDVSYFYDMSGLIMVEPNRYDIAQSIPKSISDSQYSLMCRDAKTIANNNFCWEKNVLRLIEKYREYEQI